MRDKPYFAVVYMFIVTAVFTSVLVGFSRLTRQRVKNNEQLAFEKAVVQVFPTIQADGNAQVHKIFTEKFQRRTTADNGVFFVYVPEDEVAGYAVPVEGKGFWDTIKGVVGIASDQETITAVSFYEQKETPGLGARIAEPDFCGQFVGRKIASGPSPIAIRPVGTSLHDNQVFAVTGATQTCIRLETLINKGLIEWHRSLTAQEEN